MVIGILAQIPLLYINVMFFKKPEMFADTKSLLKTDDPMSQAHPIIMLASRSVLGILFGVSSLIPTGAPIIASLVQLVIVIYYLLKLPYQ
jgi:hypothetical protein